MRYLASEAKVLYGENIEERCLIDQWISHLQATFLVPLGQFYDIVLGRKMVTRSRYLALNHEIKQHLQQLDSRVKIQSFLCGTYMSLADLSLACDLFLAYRLVITDKYKKNISYLMKWYERVSRKEEFQRVFGHEWPCKK
jgi:glutathione S-transferase